ncbi:aldehyde dehydrogenase family protein [Mariniradius sediminis]|uniref:Aldehyde dehydrogenase n=1 Tax=Mariniradius sediminis TaxID=2909237 RepID=A0ABS9BUV6_9BACT|nr:aldehyde dehydrogenase family protein [Mariniradius sediminis]MCF1751840.1 aldehyde dehydrogenase family protein [Mariniradius sediminis]
MDSKTLQDRINQVFEQQKSHSLNLRTSSADLRIGMLRRLHDWILEHRQDIRDALFADYKKPNIETDITEIYPSLSEAKNTIKNLKSWMRVKRVPTPVTFLGTSAHIQYEPKGASLIVAPWNYPFNLAIGPLISAISAGCTAIVKPSEMTPNTSALIKRMISELFDENHVCVIEGGLEASQLLFAKPFDHIFFTGSPAVGKIVMRSASEYLGSVTLELGGKSPVVIAKDADLKDAARKIASTKFINCGQTCVAPDFVLIHASMRDEFVSYLKESIETLYETDGQAAIDSKDFGRIVNERHFNRLKELITDAKARGAVVAKGGKTDASQNFIEPTVITHVKPDMMVMLDEIFGPILPILDYTELDKALSFINTMPKPLALYAFSKSDKKLSYIFHKTSSGGAVANDCVLHFIHHELPFGGVNNSGIGKSHGHYGFLEFSNPKGVLKQRVGFTAVTPLFPPYNRAKEMIIDGLLKWF